MGIKKIGLVIVPLFMVAGILATAYYQFEQNRSLGVKERERNGESLIKMAVMAYEGCGTPEEQQFFYKELSYMITDNTINYCLIHKKNNPTPIISFSGQSGLPLIPVSLTTGAVVTTGFKVQAFTSDDGRPYLEFDKPMYKNGQPHEVIRLGMKLADTNFLSRKNIVIVVQVVMFVILALLFAYYGFTLLLTPVKRFLNDQRAECREPNLLSLVKQMEAFLDNSTEQLSGMTSEYRNLSAQTKVLQYENNQLLQIFEHLDFGVLMVDAQDQLFFVNGFCLSLLGKERSALLNQPIFDVLSPPKLVEFIHRQTLVEMGNVADHIEIKFPSSGPKKTFQARAVPLIGHDQTLFGYLVYIKDITREKTAEKSSRDFMNHIAHELRTPLTNIKAYNEMMMDGEIVAPEMQKEFFHTINDETHRLSNLVKNILELAETEMGQLTAKKERVETKWLHQSCLDAVEKMAGEKQIDLISNLPDNMPSVSGDKEMLKSALINVLGNAVKYTPNGGTIEFGIQDSDDTVTFQISDSGFGISADDLPHIFEKFYRSENESITDEAGTGLGLAITSEIINYHGGHIEVDSQPSKGSTFTITIPKGDLTIG